MESIGRGTLEGNVSFSFFHLMRLKVGESFMYHVRLSGLYYPKSNIRFGSQNTPTSKQMIGGWSILASKCVHGVRMRNYNKFLKESMVQNLLSKLVFSKVNSSK